MDTMTSQNGDIHDSLIFSRNWVGYEGFGIYFLVYTNFKCVFYYREGIDWPNKHNFIYVSHVGAIKDENRINIPRIRHGAVVHWIVYNSK